MITKLFGDERSLASDDRKVTQFRVLYREFLFRMVDLELLSASARGDISKLLGQFAALLIFLNSWLGLATVGFGDSQTPQAVLVVSAWGMEHFLIATTMLVVGLFAVVSWESTFPDRRDVLVLAPLPVRARTLFLAKAAAVATSLGLTVIACNAFTGLTVPLALAPASSNLLDLILSPARYRLFAAYWITMISAGGFIFCSVLGVQGLAAQLLPRSQFLRLSALLQMGAFCLFLSVYFLQPSLATPEALTATQNQRLLAWLPSYWFLGLFQELSGFTHAAMVPLARRALTGLSIAVLGTAMAYALSYFRTLRKIVEQPDIVAGSRGLHWLPPFGNSLETAVVQFSVRTLLRSRQHRMMLAFYLGIGFAIVILFMKTPRAHHQLLADNAPLLLSSVVIMCVWVVGTRVVFSMPLDLRANWIFRITQVHGAPEYLAAIRRPLFVLAVTPVWAASAGLFLSIWPWLRACGHLAVLGLWGVILSYVCLHGFQKLPFTCSYLPGKSYFHMTFLAALGLMFLILKAVEFERSALEDPASYAKALVILVIAAACARWRTVAKANSEGTALQFEEEPPAEVLVLGLNRDGTLPIEPRPERPPIV
jgi:hypothetical protein